MDRLPPEIVERILLLLSPYDRLNFALTCNHCAGAVSSPAVLKDVWMVIRGFAAGSDHFLMQSPRRYSNLRIQRGALSYFAQEFWMKVCVNIRQLELIECTLEPVVLCNLLLHCTALESLSIRGQCLGYLSPPRGVSVDTVRESLRKVRHLCLNLVLPLMEEKFDRLFELMPNVTSLEMLLHEEDRSLQEESDVSYIVPCMLKTGRKFTHIRFNFLIPGQQVCDLVAASSESLLELRLECEVMIPQAFEAIGQCTELRTLSLESVNVLGYDHLDAIIRRAPKLENLTLSTYHDVTDSSLRRLSSLVELRSLAIYPYGIKAVGGLSEVSDMRRLQHLDLRCSTFDVGSLSLFAHSENLRTLLLTCRMTSESLNVICESFTKLEVLELDQCEHLTDADGMKFRSLRHLRRLTFEGGKDFDDRVFEGGLGSSDMEVLSIKDCPLTDVGLRSIAAHHGRLKTLELRYCPKFTDKGLVNLLRGQPFLIELGVTDCRSLTGSWIEELKEACPRLRSLEFYPYHGHEQPRSLEWFKSQRPWVVVNRREYDSPSFPRNADQGNSP